MATLLVGLAPITARLPCWVPAGASQIPIQRPSSVAYSPTTVPGISTFGSAYGFRLAIAVRFLPSSAISRTDFAKLILKTRPPVNLVGGFFYTDLFKTEHWIDSVAPLLKKT